MKYGLEQFEHEFQVLRVRCEWQDSACIVDCVKCAKVMIRQRKMVMETFAGLCGRRSRLLLAEERGMPLPQRKRLASHSVSFINWLIAEPTSLTLNEHFDNRCSIWTLRIDSF